MILPILYGFLCLLVAILLLQALRTMMRLKQWPEGKIKSKLWMFCIGFGLWVLVQFFIGERGLLWPFELPPRLPILVVGPAFILVVLSLRFVFKNNLHQGIHPSKPIFFQSFRILVETLFVYSVAEGILHKEVTFEGYNMDLLFAATAFVMAVLARRDFKRYRKLLIAWNFLGLAVIASIIFLFTTTLYFPEMWGNSQSTAPKEFTEFPYLLVAGFLMPSAVMTHIFSLRQLLVKT